MAGCEVVRDDKNNHTPSREDGANAAKGRAECDARPLAAPAAQYCAQLTKTQRKVLLASLSFPAAFAVKTASESLATVAIPNLSSVMSQSGELLEELCYEIPQGLPREQALSVLAYTLECQGESVARYLNTALSRPARKSLSRWRSYLYLLLSGLEWFPKYSGATYRGVDFAVDAKPGEKFFWPAFTSTSTNPAAARKFARNSKKSSVFYIETNHGRLLGKFSAYPEEEEVIIAPAATFVVMSSAVVNGTNTVHLRQTGNEGIQFPLACGELLVSRGFGAWRAGKCDEAADIFRLTRALDPGFVVASLALLTLHTSGALLETGYGCRENPEELYASTRSLLAVPELLERGTRFVESLAALDGNKPKALHLYYAGVWQKEAMKNAKKAFQLWRRAAQLGQTDAMNSLGAFYLHGAVPKKNTAKAFSWFRRASEGGNHGGTFNVGVCLLKGEGVERDQAAAVEKYAFAAKHGHLTSIFQLGVLHETGLLADSGSAIVAQDKKAARNFYERAARKGHIAAKWQLACLLHDSEDKKDKTRAFAIFYEAAADGNKPALFNIAVCYQLGHGVGVDIDKAEEYYERAVTEGKNSQAAFNLSLIYMNQCAVETPRNTTEPTGSELDQKKTKRAKKERRLLRKRRLRVMSLLAMAKNAGHAGAAKNYEYFVKCGWPVPLKPA